MGPAWRSDTANRAMAIRKQKDEGTINTGSYCIPEAAEAVPYLSPVPSLIRLALSCRRGVVWVLSNKGARGGCRRQLPLLCDCPSVPPMLVEA